MKRVRSRLSYANVMATLALFIALGGASYAATALPKNSVGTKQIKSAAITAAKIKNGAVTGAKIAPGSITGGQIALSTLGTVPSATKADQAVHADTATTATNATRATSAASADDARTLGGQSAEQIAAAAKLTCPTGMILAAGNCFDATQTAASTYYSALEKCAAKGKSVPDTGDMANFLTAQGTTETDWGGSPSAVSGTLYGPLVSKTGGGVTVSVGPLTSLVGYRCEAAPTN
jgi:hypothetical protein